MISLIDTEGDTIAPYLPSIEYLNFASCNLTELPAALRYLDTITDLDLSNNQIKGAIPSWVWENWKDQLNTLDLSHNMFTTLEKSPSLVHTTNLAFLDLSSNRLEGTIPIPVTGSEVVVLDYSNNSFSSIVSNFGRYLTNGFYINLSKNKLSGHIPASVCSLNKLDIMDLSYNYFDGPVPSCLVERGNLTLLKLRENRLHGVLPKNIGEGCKLQTIDLNGNRIEGTLPTSLENCQDLEFLDVGNNHIVGSFPSWLGTLPNLRVLVLRSNQLNGTIRDLHSVSKSNISFTSLQIIDLSTNHFSGYLHSELFEGLKSMMNNNNDMGEILEHNYTSTVSKNIYQDTITITYTNFDFILTKIQTTLKVIDFSDNSFHGPIPKSIGRLVSLHGLNVSHNNFTGQIPSQLGNLTRLESMDLSCNHLSGEIPQVLTSLTFLSWLNLSYNNLSGRIPQGNQFFSFPYSSFEGNAGLCGSQVSKQCDNPSSTTPKAIDHQESKSLWQDRLDAILLFTFVGLGFGVGFALAILSRTFHRVEGWICKHFCIHMYV
ncbi:receptor like protein 22-like [Miscanthus floridulus]|uniref:receptor like protein 22-like n=1 Tax=Miscanthus floridulus TaxID=154761 RepID=UPI0034582022